MSDHDPVKVMKSGHEFCLYTLEGKKQDLVVYYYPSLVPASPETPDQGPMGFLAWTARGTSRPEAYTSSSIIGSFNLDNLTDVYIGKQTESFISHPLANNATEDNCLSLVSETSSLDLEAPSEAILNSFLDGMNHILTADGNLVITNEEDNLIAQLELGMPFTFHQKDSESVTVFMVYSKEADTTNDGDNDGSFFYTAIAASASPRSDQDCVVLREFCLNSATRCRIDLSALSEVAANSDDQDFSNVPDTNTACCFTLHTTNGQRFSFEARDPVARDTWIDGITNLVKRCQGVTVECVGSNDAAASTPVAVPEATTSTDTKDSKDNRRYTVMRQETKDTSSGVVATPASGKDAMAAQISSMGLISSEDGIQFVRYPGQRPVCLSYNAKSATLHLRSYPRIELDRTAETFPVAELVDVFIGNQRPALAELSGEKCVSLVATSGLEWALDATTVEGFSAFISALNEILEGNGQVITTEGDGADVSVAPQEVDENATAPTVVSPATKKPNSRRFSVLPSSATTGTADAVATTPSTSKPALVADNTVFIQMITEGRNFTGYAERGNKVIRNQVCLFYMSPDELRAAAALEPSSSPEAAKLVAAVGRVPPKTKGRLCWCAPGRRAPAMDSFMEVGDITDVYLGKQTKLLCSSPVARDAPRDSCFSILSRHDQLDLEAESPAVIQAWVQGLQAILSSSGRNVMMEAENPTGDEEDQRLIRKKNSKRFSVAASMAPPKPTAPSGPAPPKVGAPPRGPPPTRQMTQMDYTPVQFMLDGAFLSRYFTFSGQPKSQEVYLCLEKPEPHDADRGGRLRWYDSEVYKASGEKKATSNAQLRISSISDVYVGKSTQSLKALVPAEVSSKTCFTIVGKEKDRQVVLSVRASTAEIVDEWLKGVQHVIVNSGRAVVEEKAPTTAAPAPEVSNEPPTSKASGRRFTVKSSDAGAASVAAAAVEAAPAAAPAINPKTGRRFTVKSSDATSAAVAATSSKSKAPPALTPTERLTVSAPVPVWDSFLLNSNVLSFTKGVRVTVYQQSTKDSTVTITQKSLYIANRAGKTGSVFVAEPEATGNAPLSTETTTTVEDGKIQRIGTSTECLPIDALSDIVIGKADPIWKSKEFLSSPTPIRSERCFSLCSRTNKLHCVASSKEEVNLIISALQHVLAHGGKKVYYEETASTATAGASSRKMSMVASAATSQSTPNSPFVSISKGSHVTLYNVDKATGSVIPTPTYIFFSNEANGGRGAIFYSETTSAGKVIDATSKTLSVSSVQLILRGKQTSALCSSRASRALDSKCFSIIVYSHSASATSRDSYLCLDIETESIQHAQGWLEGLTRVIASTPPAPLDSGFGKNAVTSSLGAAAPVNANPTRFMRYVNKVPHAKASHQRDIVIAMPVVSNETANSVSISTAYLMAPAVERLSHGLSCSQIIDSDASTSSGHSSSRMIVRFEAGFGQLGSISWSTIDSEGLIVTGSEAYSRQLLLTAITMVNYSSDDGSPNSVTVVGARGHAVVFKFSTPTEAALFIQALDQVLILGNISLKSVESNEKEARSRLAAALSNSNAASVANGKKSYFSQRATTAMGFDYDTIIEILEGGSQFLYFDPINVSAPPTKCVLKYQLYAQSHRGGALVVLSADNSKELETVPIDEITDLIYGLSHEAFSHAAANNAGVSDATCVSIIGRHGELHIGTSSVEDSTVWRLGISAILTSLGGTLVLESSSTGASVEETKTSSQGTQGKRRFTVLPTAAPTEDRPHDPTSTVLTSIAQDINTVIEAFSAEEMMVQGREFVYYAYENEKLIFHPTIVKYVPEATKGNSGNIDGKLSYTFLDTNENHVVSLESLTDVFLGKQSEVLTDPSLEKFDHDVCFSLHFAAGVILSFVAPTPFIASAWLLALSHALSGEGMNVVLNEETAPSNTPAPQAQAQPQGQGSTKRRYSVVPSAGMDSASALSNLPSGTVRNTLPAFVRAIDVPAVQTMIRGSYFYMFLPVSGIPPYSGVPLKMFMWLDYSVDEGGYVIAYAPAANSTVSNPTYISSSETRFPFALLTDIYVGQQAVTAPPVGNGTHRIVPDNCITFKGEGKMALYLESDSNSTHDSWLQAVQYLLEHAGDAVEEQPAPVAVVDPQEVHDLEIFSRYSPSQLLKLYLHAKPEVASLSLANTVRVMTQGQVFTLFPSELEKDMESVEITFTYEPDVNGKGMLHWKPVTPSANAPTFASGRTKLSRLSDIFLGVSQAAFKVARDKVKQQGGSPDTEISRDCCVALVFKSTVLHLRAPSRTVLCRWMWGINELLRSGSSSVVAAQAKAAPAAAQPTPAQEPTSSVNDTNPQLTEKMKAGTQLVTYRNVKFGNENIVERAMQLVYYDSELHALVHVSPGAPRVALEDQTNVLLLDSVTDVYVGKDAPELQSPVAAAAPEEDCVSIMAQMNASVRGLHVQASSADELQAWIQGFSHLLTLAGADVVVSEAK